MEIVDRRQELARIDPKIIVTLDSGFTVEFTILNLQDETYIHRAMEIKRLKEELYLFSPDKIIARLKGE